MKNDFYGVLLEKWHRYFNKNDININVPSLYDKWNPPLLFMRLANLSPGGVLIVCRDWWMNVVGVEAQDKKLKMQLQYEVNIKIRFF